MSLSTLQAWLLSQDLFSALLHRVTASCIRSDLPAITYGERHPVSMADWNYLLTCGSILAMSDGAAAQANALRIATATLLEADSAPEQRDAAAFIYERLRNRAAITLAENRQLIARQFGSRLPLPLQFDAVRSNLASSLFLADGEVIRVNRFQGEAWEAFETNGCVSISAPTSSGKSFLLKRWLEVTLAAGVSYNVVFVVPTRALIHEVETDLRNHFLARGRLDVTVSSMPVADVLESAGSHILVYTQERLHLFSTRIVPDFRPDILIIDEAQKVGDPSRGVLLQQTIESAAGGQLRNLIYAAPYVENPEILVADAPLEMSSQAVESEQVTVCQNLLWAVQQRRQPRKWNILLVDGKYEETLGELQLRFDPSPESKRLTFLADALGSASGGNLVYVNGAADAEKAAIQLFDLAASSDKQTSPELQDLIDLTKRTVHADYGLARVLERGIAFHYGNMPLILRIGIEQLFKKDKLRFLVCTSTLLEGVNLPCRSVFVRGPQKGRKHPMTPADFWNLAGRAGRWGREFQGNIVCVDADQPHVWKTYGAPPKVE